MLRPIQLPIVAPVGAGIELVDDDDPVLMRSPLVIVGSAGISTDQLYRKFLDYRIWHRVLAIKHEPGLTPAGPRSQMVDVIQNLYLQLDDGSDYAEGVDSVGIIYPKAAESKVREQLSKFPPALSLVASHGGADSSISVSRRSGNKAIHVQGRNGTKSLLVLEQRLDIELEKPDIVIFLTIPPTHLGWLLLPRMDRPCMLSAGHQS